MYMLILFKLVQTILDFIVQIIHNNRPKKRSLQHVIIASVTLHHSQLCMRRMKKQIWRLKVGKHNS